MVIVNLLTYTNSNPRLDGLKILRQITKKLHIDAIDSIDAQVITEDVFNRFLKHGDFTLEDKKELNKAFADMLRIAPLKQLTIRRAYVVPSLENPPGPRFLGIKTVEDALFALRKIFTFAIKHRYHLEKGSKVEAFFYPFIDPPSLTVPIRDDAVLSNGGYAAPLDKDAQFVRVLAVWGNNEGVQSLPGVDEYLVDTAMLTITKKSIAQKELAICTTYRAQDDKVQLPLKFQFMQVMRDWDILAVAQVVREAVLLTSHPKRVEFTSNGELIIFNELFDYSLEEPEVDTDITINGKICVVRGPYDIQKVHPDDARQIIYIDKEVVKNRDFDSLNALAGLQHPLTILYPGTTTTAHAMRVLVDAGHRAFVVGNKEFEDEDTVEIIVRDGKVTVKKEKSEIHSKKIIPLDLAGSQELSFVGGKAHNLGKLIAFGYRIPFGYVITTAVREDKGFFKSKDFQELLDHLPADKVYAVRSSADIEDSSKNAFAGQFESYLFVKKEDIAQKVQEVWKSAHTLHVTHLLQDLNIAKAEIAVVVHEMVDPVYGGVIFGANLETKNPNQVVIEITKGTAQGVVDGVAKVRRIIFDKTMRKKLHDTGDKKWVDITSADIDALLEMYLRLEDNFQSMQDVEWSIDKDNNLFILQTRPLIV